MTSASDHAAAERLAEALQRENAALAALELAAVGPLLEEKIAALAAFTASPPPQARAVVMRLRDLAAENRQLLERAILVQGRVIGTIARAAPRAVAAAPASYGRTGAAASAQRLPAVALSARC